ncbi:3-oxoacyl-[acyl-carrier-protein] reductase [Aristophania vespae]|uniref:3-oxoacyl-[acyl-carrier-protein] reductase n=1 Tax=Aristophania vespae TaxID=2697033 RepID=A0A6P1NIW3_9PROT|nr:3-oxoacyl-[acyl-carrier-protein] reductase [Aristophania vespae]QHI95602.1 3-oxoacyl-[acyl-carrier-protein] reductase [Aristophania vespae]UMM63269.1 3-oxoacyl-[acyl-carrier-protein] reductase FabG [Aristophania vespae]
MFSLSGKLALVTGATGGIGAAIVKQLHQAGAHVVITGTRENALKDLADSLGGERIFCLAANLSEAEQADNLLDRAEELAGQKLDILVNNAGLTRDTLAIRMKDKDWTDVITLDLESPFRLARAALKGMLRRRSGRIISISSIVGVTGNPGQANYVAAKAGLIGMSKALAQEAGSRGVTVNVVAPGFVETPMTDVLPDSVKQKLLDSIPLGRMGKPEDIASAVLYLASNEASWVTGTTLHVNGGMAMV